MCMRQDGGRKGKVCVRNGDTSVREMTGCEVLGFPGEFGQLLSFHVNIKESLRCLSTLGRLISLWFNRNGEFV